MKTRYLCALLPVILSGCASLAQTHSTSDSPDVVKLKKVVDIDQRFKELKDPSVEDRAKVIAEVDEWFIAPEDENPASERIKTEIDELRKQIRTEVIGLLNEALKAVNGKDAHEKISRANTLLSFYPAPETADQSDKLKEITSRIIETSKRVEDIRRLRYNEWAIKQINKSLENYRNEIRTYPLNKKPNREALIAQCRETMAVIDPAFLDPVVFDLYNYVYGLIREIIKDNDNELIVLVKVFADPNTVRKSPSDF